jgi:hypothetical protein
MFICTRCSSEKPDDQFYVWRGKRSGQCNKCRNRPTEAKRLACRRWYATKGAEYIKNWRALKGKAYERNVTLKSLYGITSEQFDAMARSQDGRCAVCRKKTTRLVVDHDHATGEVRGLLCHGCNIGIARLGDSGEAAQDTIKSALAYVSRGPFVHGASEGLLY